MKPLRALLTAAAFACAATVHAFPTKPVRIVVGFPAGGPLDQHARLLSDKLQTVLGQPVVMDYKSGAGGTVGAQEVMKSPADGHTIMLANTGVMVINPALYSKLPYATLKDFVPVARTAMQPLALLVNPNVPAKNLQEFMAYAKTRPGQVNFGSAGNGGISHLVPEMFKSATGLFMVHIPYRGSAPAFTDLMAGQTDLMFDNLSSIGSHIRAGRVRALGVSGPQRSALFPDLPTIREAGVSGYETTAWGGIVGPAGLPQAVVNRLNAAINQVLEMPAVKEKYAQMAFETVTSPPDRLMAMARDEAPRWAEVIRRSGAKVE